MKIQFIFVLFLLISSCSTKKQKDATASEKKDSLVVSTAEISNEENHEMPKFRAEASKIQSLINEKLQNIEKLIYKNEFGGGDCWGAYEKYNIRSEKNTATTYKMECGEYGFTNYQLIESESNAPIFLKTTEYKNDMDETTPDFIKEWIIDFQDTSKVYHRKYERVSYEISSVPDSIDFQEHTGEPLNIKETLSTIKSSKTAKKEED